MMANNMPLNKILPWKVERN